MHHFGFLGLKVSQTPSFLFVTLIYGNINIPENAFFHYYMWKAWFGVIYINVGWKTRSVNWLHDTRASIRSPLSAEKMMMHSWAYLQVFYSQTCS